MIYLHKPFTGMGRLARELRLSVATKRPNTQTFGDLLPRRNFVTPSINWGCGRSAIVTLPTVEILNDDISVARSKRATFERLAEAEVAHPRWSQSYVELRERLGLERTILARLDQLSGGMDILIVGPHNLADIYAYDFYVERLSCQRELRVHCWGGAAIATQVKVIPPGCTNFIHSYVNGCTFSQHLGRWGIGAELATQAQGLALRAVEAVGLDFGAVDLMLTRRGKLYVLEVNSAPGIRSDYIKQAYARVLGPMIRRRGR